MTDVIVTEANDSTVIQQQQVQSVVVDEKKATVVVTGMMPPPAVNSIIASSDVDLSSLSDGGILVYDSTTSMWKATNLLEKQIFEAGQF